MGPFFAIVIPTGGYQGGGNYPSQGLPVYPDQGLPGMPVYPSQGPGFPTHPIAPGGGGGAPVYPSQGPGFPTQLPMPGGGGGAHPSQPIFLPPTVNPAPPTVWPPLPPSKPAPIEGYYLAYVPALGRWVYIPVDESKPVPVPEPK
jgi:hypothetical protein